MTGRVMQSPERWRKHQREKEKDMRCGEEDTQRNTERHRGRQRHIETEKKEADGDIQGGKETVSDRG